MGNIDEPFDQIEAAYREKSGGALSKALSLTAPFIAVITQSETVGALAAVGAYLSEFLSGQRKEARAEAFTAELVRRVKQHDLNIEELEKRLLGPEADEAVATAVQLALTTANYEKARQYGSILGNTLASPEPDWKEAAEFIRNVQQFTQSDIDSLKILWRFQRVAFQKAESKKQMPTDANSFTRTWKEVLDTAQKKGFSSDDWDARCGRLGGFGLATIVQWNPGLQGTNSICYRLTGRGVRILGLLGWSVDPGKYPSVRHYEGGRTVIVQDEDEERALPPGWANTPAAFQKR